MNVHCIATEFYFCIQNCFECWNWEYPTLNPTWNRSWDVFPAIFAITLDHSVGHFNFLKFSTYVSYVMEESATKRARRAVGTVCDACGKHFSTSNGYDQHQRSWYLRDTLATSEMMDQVDPKWWPQQEPTCLQHCYRSLGCQMLKNTRRPLCSASSAYKQQKV